jgi:hypothetical protein
MPRAMEDFVFGGVGKKWAERLEKFQVRFTCRINLKKFHSSTACYLHVMHY